MEEYYYLKVNDLPYKNHLVWLHKAQSIYGAVAYLLLSFIPTTTPRVLGLVSCITCIDQETLMIGNLQDSYREGEGSGLKVHC